MNVKEAKHIYSLFSRLIDFSMAQFWNVHQMIREITKHTNFSPFHLFPLASFANGKKETNEAASNRYGVQSQNPMGCETSTQTQNESINMSDGIKDDKNSPSRRLCWQMQQNPENMKKILIKVSFHAGFG